MRWLWVPLLEEGVHGRIHSFLVLLQCVWVCQRPLLCAKAGKPALVCFLEPQQQPGLLCAP